MFCRTAGQFVGRRAGARRVGEGQEPASAAGGEARMFWRCAGRVSQFYFYSQRTTKSTSKTPHSPFQSLRPSLKDASHHNSSTYQRRTYNSPAVSAFVATCGTMCAKYMFDDERREKALLNARIMAERVGLVREEDVGPVRVAWEKEGVLGVGGKGREEWADLVAIQGVEEIVREEADESVPWADLIGVGEGVVRKTPMQIALRDVSERVGREKERMAREFGKSGYEDLVLDGRRQTVVEPLRIGFRQVATVETVREDHVPQAAEHTISATRIEMKVEKVEVQSAEPTILPVNSEAPKAKTHVTISAPPPSASPTQKIKQLTKRDSAIDLSLDTHISSHEALQALTLGFHLLTNPTTTPPTTKNQIPLHLFQAAAELGNPSAAYNAALCFHTAKGGADKVDLVRASVLYRQAAYAGHVDAMFNLGVILVERGEVREGAEWIRKAAEAG
ncbi:hypothetical protein HK097_005132, partial [Rhizophlyctis rosea]